MKKTKITNKETGLVITGEQASMKGSGHFSFKVDGTHNWVQFWKDEWDVETGLEPGLYARSKFHQDPENYSYILVTDDGYWRVLDFTSGRTEWFEGSEEQRSYIVNNAVKIDLTGEEA